MKLPITLKRSHFKGTRCYVSPSFITNGHWAIRKTCVLNNEAFKNADTILAAFPGLTEHITVAETDETVQRMFDRVESAEDIGPLSDARVLMDIRGSDGKDTYARIFTKAGGVLCLFDTKYLDAFGVESDDKAAGDSNAGSVALFADRLLLMPLNPRALEPRFLPLLPALEKLVTEGAPFSTTMERKQNLQVAANSLTSALQAVHQQLAELETKKAA